MRASSGWWFEHKIFLGSLFLLKQTDFWCFNKCRDESDDCHLVNTDQEGGSRIIFTSLSCSDAAKQGHLFAHSIHGLTTWRTHINVHPPGFLNVESSDLGEVSSWVRGKYRFVQKCCTPKIHNKSTAQWKNWMVASSFSVTPILMYRTHPPYFHGRIPGCLSGFLASLRPRRCSTCLGPSRLTGSKLCILGEDVTCGYLCYTALWILWEGWPSTFRIGSFGWDRIMADEAHTTRVTFPTGMAMSLPISRDHPWFSRQTCSVFWAFARFGYREHKTLVMLGLLMLTTRLSMQKSAFLQGTTRNFQGEASYFLMLDTPNWIHLSWPWAALSSVRFKRRLRKDRAREVLKSNVLQRCEKWWSAHVNLTNHVSACHDC